MNLLSTEFIILLDDGMARVATLAILAGAVLIRMLNWTLVGWVAVILGLMALWLAHHLAIAPYLEDLPGSHERLAKPADRCQSPSVWRPGTRLPGTLTPITELQASEEPRLGPDISQTRTE